MGEGEVHRGARGRVPRFASHGSGEDPRRSDSARLPSVTLALAAPGPPVQLRCNYGLLRSVYRARPFATRRSLTTATARLKVAPQVLPTPL